jgi:hypothetical protein
LGSRVTKKDTFSNASIKFIKAKAEIVNIVGTPKILGGKENKGDEGNKTE